jgi:hypothetical protein
MSAWKHNHLWGKAAPLWFGKGTVTLHKEQKQQGNTMMDSSLLPRFGPLCSVKHYSCFGGLIWRWTKARRALAWQGSLGESNISLQMLGVEVFEPFARLPRECCRARTMYGVWCGRVELVRESNPLLGFLGPPFIAQGVTTMAKQSLSCD